MNVNELYQALAISTQDELLRIFPSHYESFRLTGVDPVPVERKRYVLKGQIHDLKSVNARGTSIIRFSLYLSDHRDVSLILFNQPFYLSKLNQSTDLVIACYYSESRKAFIVSAIVDGDSYVAISGIRPYYSLPRSVSQSYFANQIRKALSYPMASDYLHSPLPKILIKKYDLMEEYTAFKAVHLPRNDEELKKGLRVFKYEEALRYCIQAQRLKKAADQRKRKAAQPISHSAINAFVHNLPYKLTQDQITAIRDIVLDMEKDKVMYRLLQGDVGTGKTIVGFAALYAVTLRKQQGCLMAPTFELATQHYENALKIFKDYPIKIAFLSGNMTAKERNSLLKEIKDGSIDIVISTHAAISESVSFKDLGLAIIDEQQRFGVRQREEIIDKSGSCDLLMMSATPIPRTLSQIINADLDVSTLSEFPNGLRQVKTAVIRSTDPLLDEAVKKALASKRQIFVVTPKIEAGLRATSSAADVYQDFCKRYGEANCQLLHGRIKKDEQDRIYQAFLSGEKPILVSTTIVEVGIDVSRAGLLIVYDANCFGLSSLHQLRGRIGRSGDFALALLIYDGDDPDAFDKLTFLSQTNDGLAISEYDLKQRGSGSYSGERQSGKSELTVCNFVDDYAMFLAAKNDAQMILAHPEDPENQAYLKTLTDSGDTFLA